jgi:hypothetical protein
LVTALLASGFDVLRFAWWQRIWGDARNAQMNRALAERATPASQTYLGKDGVSWQDMVALANQVRHVCLLGLDVVRH